MEDNKGGGNGVEVLESKHFDMNHFQNPVFAVGMSNYSQHQGAMSTTSRNVPKKPASPKRIPRPMNAFMIFSNENRTEMRRRFPLLQNKELSKRLGAVWRKLGKEEQDIYYRKAKLASEDHRRKYPDYHYRPRGRGPNAPDKLNKSVKGGATMPPMLNNQQIGNQTLANLNQTNPAIPTNTAALMDIPSSSSDGLMQQNANSASRSRRSRSRVPCPLSLSNLSNPGAGMNDAFKPAFFGNTGSNALAAVTNLCQQYLNYGSADLLNNAGKHLSVPSALNDGLSRVLHVPGPAHNNGRGSGDNSNHYKQLYSHDGNNFAATSGSLTPWLPSLALSGSAPYAHQPFPVFLLNQPKSAGAVNPYLSNIPWRPQNGIESYLRMPPTNIVDGLHGSHSMSSNNCSYLTPPPSHAGSTSSVSSPPFSVESSHSNSSVPTASSTVDAFSSGQQSIPTPVPPHFSSAYPTRHFFGAPQINEPDDRQNEASGEADEHANYGSWDNSNTDNLGYETSATPFNPCFSSDGTTSQQSNSVGATGYIMSDDDHSHDAINMTTFSGYQSAMNSLSATGSWRDIQSHQEAIANQLYSVSQSQSYMSATSPLALNQLRLQANSAIGADSDQQTTDLRVFPDDLINNQDDMSNGHKNSPFNFSSKAFPDQYRDYGDAFSVSTVATSEDDQSPDLEDDDQLLNFNFSCDDNGMAGSCSNGMLTNDFGASASANTAVQLESYGNYDSGGDNRWDLQDDLNDDSGTTVGESCRPQSRIPNSTASVADCALLEAADSVM